MGRLGVLFAALVAGVALADEPLPASVYARLPAVAHADVSPDGKRVVMVRAFDGVYHAVVLDLELRQSRLVLAADPDQFRLERCRFANNERVVCTIYAYRELMSGFAGFNRYRDARTTFTRLIAVNVDGSNPLQLIPSAGSDFRRPLLWSDHDQSDVISWTIDDPDHILVQLARDDQNYPSVYRLNVYDNAMDRVQRHRPPVLDWKADRFGNVRFASGYMQRVAAARFNDGDGWRPVDLRDALGVRESLGQLEPADDGSTAFALLNKSGDKRGLYRIVMATGEVVETLLEDPHFDVGEFVLHPVSGRPAYAVYAREANTVHWFDQDTGAKIEAFRRALPGPPPQLEVAAYDRTFSTFVLLATGPDATPALYHYDATTRQGTEIARWYDDLGPAVLRDSVSYTARDGMRIPAYLALPGPREAGPYPAVLLPHDGPWQRDSASGYDHQVQFLVSRGYAVLQPNYRGSEGYGDAFLEAGFGQWGLAIQDDVIDGLDWLVEQRIADPGRICIVGGGFGGYVALVAAYKTPERIRCAVSYGGVTDLDELAEFFDNKEEFFDDQEEWLVAPRLPAFRERAALSPVDNVERIGVPLLILHGDTDHTIGVEHSRKLVARLEAAGKPHRYVEQAGGDHELGLEPHRVQFLEELEAFLGEHLTARPRESDASASG